jgi:6-phosphogluconolactonase
VGYSRSNKMKKSIKVFSTPLDTAKALASYITSEINGILNISEKCTVALSGGTTPKLLFEILAARYAGAVNWDSVHFFWVDERCVPPDDKESNYGMAVKTFLSGIRIPSSNIHRIKGEDNPESEALRYSEELVEIASIRNGLPGIDIILLGMGDDGHTASIFPGNEDLFSSGSTYVTAVHPVTGQKRVTLTGKAINNAGEVIIFVTGRNKAGIAEKAINNKECKKKLPISCVNPLTGKLTWYLDDEAASMLKMESLNS